MRDEDLHNFEAPDDVTARKIGENESRFREANERIRRTAKDLELDPEQRIPFVCECPRESCFEVVQLTLPEYEAVRASPVQFLVALRHGLNIENVGEVVAERDGHALVRKSGAAGQVAAERNPRR